jgi:hypothetical protein
MASFGERMIGAARLDAATYEEVEADTTATGQAALVVVISSLCIALGAQLHAGVGGVIAVTVLRLIAWWAWALVAWLIGTRLLPGPSTEADVGQLLRTVGFASAPGVAAILGVVPGTQGVVNIVVSLWMLATMVVAVRQALDYETTGRAIAVVVIGFLVYLLIAFVLTSALVGASQTP